MLRKTAILALLISTNTLSGSLPFDDKVIRNPSKYALVMCINKHTPKKSDAYLSSLSLKKLEKLQVSLPVMMVATGAYTSTEAKRYANSPFNQTQMRKAYTNVMYFRCENKRKEKVEKRVRKIKKHNRRPVPHKV